jgi:hypothetical protein
MDPGSAAHHFVLRSIRGTQKPKAGSDPGLFFVIPGRCDFSAEARSAWAEAASPESILTMVVMDSGPACCARIPE